MTMEFEDKADKDFPSVVDYLNQLVASGDDPENVIGVINVVKGLGQLTAKTANSFLEKIGVHIETDDPEG